MFEQELDNFQLISTHPIKKSDLGFHGNLFGGKLLAWLDAAGAGFAAQVCDTPRMVTIKIDECLFKKASKEGQLLKIYGKVYEFGTTSVTLLLECRSHSVYTGRQTVVLTTNIKFVRIDENGDAIPISDRVKDKLKPKMSKELTKRELELIKKWEETGLLDDIDGMSEKKDISKLLEGKASQLLREENQNKEDE